MNKRPVSVVILSALFIATGIISFAFHLGDFKPSQHFQYEFILLSLVRLSAAVCGVFMLRGSNWARWFAVAWMAFQVAISFFDSLQKVAVHLLFLALIAYFLFRPKATAYFLPQEGLST